MRKLFVLPLGLMLATMGAHSASANVLDAATIMKDFNTVIYGNAKTPSDVEGAAVIGGNFSGATLYNNPTQSQPSGYGALTVYGNTSGNSINLNNGGSAYVGGTKGAGINFNGGGSYSSTVPSQGISAFETTLNTLSSSLSQLSATSSLPRADNNELITATAGSNGIAVFNVSASDLAAIPSYKLNLNGASTVVFNVSGSTVNFNANLETGTTGANNIIWNFYQATRVNLGTQIAGAVLATGANVTNGNQIDGFLAAQSWTGSGELHDYGFTGALPATSVVTAAPEPSTWAMMLIGLGAVGVITLRRRNAAPAYA